MTAADSPVVVRPIGPGPVQPGDGRVLAADGQLAAAILTLWQEAALTGRDPVFDEHTPRSQIAPEVAELMQRIRVSSAFGVAATVGKDLVGVAVVVRRGVGQPARSGLIRALLDGSPAGLEVSEQLLQRLLALAGEHGWHDVLVTVPERSSAATFYRQRDFETVGRWPGSPGSPENLLLRRAIEADEGEPASPGSSRSGRLVELSHVIRDGMTTYPGIPVPRIGSHLSFDESAAHYAAGTEFSIATIEMAANTGTYLDTPAHRFRDGADLSGVPLDRLVDLPGVVLDVRPQLSGGRRAIEEVPISPADTAGRAVLLCTGHSRFWGSDRYFADHPYLTESGIQRLVDAGVALVGIDSLNIDSTDTGERPGHTRLLAAGIPIVEHLTALDRLPARGFRFSAAPPRIEGMGTFPVRAYALVEPDPAAPADAGSR